MSSYRITFCDREALKSIFNGAPCQKYFSGDNLLLVQQKLRELFHIFNGDTKSKTPLNSGLARMSNDKITVVDDERVEIVWSILRYGLPTWQIAWTYWSRARIRPNNDYNLIKNKFVEDDAIEPVGQTTRIKLGAIVFIKPSEDNHPSTALEKWLKARYSTLILLR